MEGELTLNKEEKVNAIWNSPEIDFHLFLYENGNRYKFYKLMLKCNSLEI